MEIIWNVLLLSVAVFGVGRLLPGVHLKNFGTAVLVAVVYSIINFFLFKILLIVSFPITILTFGLFIFIINAFLLWLTDLLIDDFKIDSFLTTIAASFLITVSNIILTRIF